MVALDSAPEESVAVPSVRLVPSMAAAEVIAPVAVTDSLSVLLALTLNVVGVTITPSSAVPVVMLVPATIVVAPVTAPELTENVPSVSVAPVCDCTRSCDCSGTC